MPTQDSAKREMAARQSARARLALMPNYDDSAAPAAAPTQAGASPDVARKLIDDATRELVSETTLQRQLDALRAELGEKIDALQNAAPAGAKATETAVDAPASRPTTQPNAPVSATEPSNPITPDAPAASKPKAPRTTSSAIVSARCLAHGGEHYFGATSGEVIEAWAEMREQFGMRTPHKVKTRTSFKQWLQKFRRVCADSVHWYGDFVLVRSDASRTTEPREARAEDGWFIFPDPNSDGYLDHALMFEAFDKSTDSLRGPVSELVRPAWISETARLAEASRLGREDSMPFTRGTLDEVRADALVRGDIR